MRPCDCKDNQDAMSMETQGIGINDWTFGVEPAVVEIGHRHYGNIKIPMTIMKKFAEWYLEDHDKECNCKNGCSSSNCDKR